MKDQIKRFTVFRVGGDHDGETIATFDKEKDAIEFASHFFDDIERDFENCWDGVAIYDGEKQECVEW